MELLPLPPGSQPRCWQLLFFLCKDGNIIVTFGVHLTLFVFSLSVFLMHPLQSKCFVEHILSTKVQSAGNEN